MKISLNRRVVPRINVSLPIRFSPNVVAEIIDISESGMKILVEQSIASKAKCYIEAPGNKNLKVNFKVLWSKKLVERQGVLHGVCFVKLEKNNMDALREVFLNESIDPIIKDICDKKIIKLIERFFLNDVKEYISNAESIVVGIKRAKKVSKRNVDQLTKYTDEILMKADKLSKNLKNKLLIKKIKKCFRACAGYLAYRSNIVRRGYEKPRGYPGDYRMLEIVYNEEILSSGFGECFDRYFLKSPYAEAVRKRKDFMGNSLLKLINASKAKNLDILNLACGPSREIKDILESKRVKYSGKISFGLVDFDDEAIKFSKKTLNSIKNKKVRFKYFKENVLKFNAKNKHYLELFGSKDIIYSIGLIDYFPDRLLKVFINFCISLLSKNGVLLLSIKDEKKDPFAPLPPMWFCDWEFVPRDNEYMLNLLYGLGHKLDIKTSLDKTGKIVFYEIKRMQD
ncbi:MAG: PilZ domain-containing protein [Candidatus Zapsychrus exili]|nr:PilZ domain-containing protein [Candidatus Zapsychrus exili]